MSKLLIIGGSKGIGRETVKLALQHGHSVRLFARSAEDVDIHNDRLEKFRGDALSADDVKRAIEGIDAVIQTLGVPVNSKLITGPITLFSESTKILLPAMAEAGVDRLIALTGFGAGDSKKSISLLQRAPFEIAFGRAYTDKSKQEALIKTSSLRWTIARPGVLLNRSKVTNYDVLVDEKRWRNGMISRINVADFLVRQVEDPSLIGEAPVLRSPGPFGVLALAP
ncbi:MAG: NAD(P)H-binding protein [Pseudomonadota bacterium]